MSLMKQLAALSITSKKIYAKTRPYPGKRLSLKCFYSKLHRVGALGGQEACS